MKTRTKKQKIRGERKPFDSLRSLRARKSLGQHFLTSRAIIAAIAEAGEVTADDTVIEIGPGTGNLTGELIARGAHVIAIEKDSRALPILRLRFERAIRDGQLTLVGGDALDEPLSNFAGEKPYKVVANIPYYVTGLILRHIFSAPALPTRVVLLIQREVAERIARNKKESVLSIAVKAYGTPRYVRTVPRGNFSPRPSVDSAILEISLISRSFSDSADEARFFEVLKRGFGKKRKVLAGNLAPRGKKDEVLVVFERLGIPARARAEDISADTWKKLARALATIHTG